jgi:molybdopterin converting factor small subunit
VKVYVKLYALLRKHHPGPNRSVPLEVELPAGATVAELSLALSLPPNLVRSAFINNEAAAPLTTVLHDGDQIGLFPPVVGGARSAHDKIGLAGCPRPYSLSG